MHKVKKNKGFYEVERTIHEAQTDTRTFFR